MVEKEVFVALLKRDINDGLQIQGITFEQVHMILRQAVEKMLMYDRKKYGEQINRYIEKETELNEKIKEATEELITLRKELAGNDEKMYEAIKKL